MTDLADKITVLVVEDETALRTIASMALSQAGFRVVEAGSGVQAIQLSSEYQIDVLVTDIALGQGMNGDAVAKECRKANPALPVVFASGNSQEANETDFDLGDYCHYLAKPYSPKALVEAVRDCVARGRVVPTP